MCTLQDAIAFRAFDKDNILTMGTDHYEVCVFDTCKHVFDTCKQALRDSKHSTGSGGGACVPGRGYQQQAGRLAGSHHLCCCRPLAEFGDAPVLPGLCMPAALVVPLCPCHGHVARLHEAARTAPHTRVSLCVLVGPG